MDELLKEYPVALSISDVAEILNITPSTVRRHIKSNDLPHIKIGKHVRIPKESLIVYLHGDQTPYKRRKRHEREEYQSLTGTIASERPASH